VRRAMKGRNVKRKIFRRSPAQQKVQVAAPSRA
jgi:hypothetical protein